MSILNNYPGAKTNTGIISFLINNIPYHKRYFELFAGSAQLYRHKLISDLSILADIDTNVYDALMQDEELIFELGQDLRIYNQSFDKILDAYILSFSQNDFIYLDPPYPKTARRSGKKYYKHEMLELDEHAVFLERVKAVKFANVMISTRPNDLYDIELKDWRKKEFETRDRAGNCTEVIYMNYREPEFLHQYDHLGDGCTDRQRIKRKITRFTNKLAGLPAHEKTAILQSLINHNAKDVRHILNDSNCLL